jgi:hypothetical protein
MEEAKNLKVILYKQQQAIEDMDDASLNSFLDNRFEDMKGSNIRKIHQKYWDEADSQFTALTIRDEF